MKFKKGHIPWNKGKKMSYVHGMLGKKHSKETKEKMSKAKKKNPVRYWLGKKFSEDHRKKISIGHKGDKSHTWKGGIYSLNPKKYARELRRKKRENPLMRKKYYKSVKKWRKNNLDKVYFWNGRRRVLKVEAEGEHSFKEWLELKRQYNNKCLACGKSGLEVILTEDHIIPLSKGGSDYIENIQPLCKSCNSSKNNKIIDYRIFRDRGGEFYADSCKK